MKRFIVLFAHVACIGVSFSWGAPPAWPSTRSKPIERPVEQRTELPPSTPAAPGAQSPSFPKAQIDEGHLLRPGDRVSFSIAEDRKPALELVVMASGEIDTPYVGRYPAAGKTCRQLSQQLKVELEKTFYKRATVTVGLNQTAVTPLQATGNIRVYFTGAVRAQGAMEFSAEEPMTVSRAILTAGGFADFANQRKVQLIRRLSDGKTQISTVDVYKLLQGKPGEDPVLQANDMIRVPEKLINF